MSDKIKVTQLKYEYLDCPFCNAACVLEIKQKIGTQETLSTYMDCDCGYTEITDETYTFSFGCYKENSKEMQGFVWETGKYIRTARELTDEESRKIIESREIQL